jgi:hypothetical protein
MNIARFVGFLISGALWEAALKRRATPHLQAGMNRLVDVGSEALESYQGMKGGAASSAKRPRKPAAAKTPAAAPKPRGRPKGATTLAKEAKERQLAALAKGRETRRKNLAAQKRAEGA